MTISKMRDNRAWCQIIKIIVFPLACRRHRAGFSALIPWKKWPSWHEGPLAARIGRQGCPKAAAVITENIDAVDAPLNILPTLPQPMSIARRDPMLWVMDYAGESRLSNYRQFKCIIDTGAVAPLPVTSLSVIDGVDARTSTRRPSRHRKPGMAQNTSRLCWVTNSGATG